MEFIRSLVSALGIIQLATVYWDYDNGERTCEVCLLGIGWRGIEIAIIDGRPTFGFEYRYGTVAMWLGPIFFVLGRP